MPRGGGSRGSRIGGFSGGGFRGGGFRGGPASFRTSSTIRSSGRPFGRTGASRTVSRTPSGPYRHTYYRPRRRHYGYWRTPWYRRFWYSPYWSGYYYRPWYYSPAYIGGGIVIAILAALIILPLVGVAFAFPFDNADPSGKVNYRSTEIIYYNEYWYEYEFIKTGNNISFTVDSAPSIISFAIWDKPFDNFPTTTETGNTNETIQDITQDEYEYWTLFLKPGSSISYAYNASDEIDFFIADAYDFYLWNQFENPVFYKDVKNQNQSSGSLSISEAKDYYLVWYNDESGSIDVTYDINYSASNVIDLAQADYYELEVDTVSGSFEVPNDGEWYFFIYFDPMDSPEEATTITFDVSYDTGVTSAVKWVSIQPILIIVIVVIIIIIIAAFIARKSQKKTKEKKLRLKTQKKTAKTSPKKVGKPTSPYKSTEVSKADCLRCGAKLKPEAKFCHICGGAVEGRKVVSSQVDTPAESDTCIFCGNKVKSEDKFCRYCGTKISENRK
ncbi:MAG: hypothetical protein GF317_11325 [Candidatus Lokiarchaeota archaeon]|nr:hypothetical protein [Candidatus Lokiarchaeota archaeon]MBD3200240.1 hypothetical protein [Candidatus Lokiarchaeota archaeon]